MHVSSVYAQIQSHYIPLRKSLTLLLGLLLGPLGGLEEVVVVTAIEEFLWTGFVLLGTVSLR
jgi:hypothetical protein